MSRLFLLKCEYDGLDGPWTKLALTIKVEEPNWSIELEGHVLIENDGRDWEVTGGVGVLDRSSIVDLFCEEGNIDLFEEEVKVGTSAWDMSQTRAIAPSP